MSFAEYPEYDGLGLVEVVTKGDISPTELVEEAISRIEKHNPALNAVIYKMYDQGRLTAARPATERPIVVLPSRSLLRSTLRGQIDPASMIGD